MFADGEDVDAPMRCSCGDQRVSFCYRSTMRVACFSLLCLAALLPNLASPGTTFADPPDKDRVRQLLSGFEGVAPQTAWRALGPSTVAVLAELYDDASEPPFIRMRAVQVSAYYPTEATRTFLRRVVQAPDQNDLILRRAVMAFTTAFGEGALEDVRPFLSHRTGLIREAAIRAVAQVGTPSALALLQARLRIERDPEVRVRLDEALRP